MLRLFRYKFYGYTSPSLRSAIFGGVVHLLGSSKWNALIFVFLILGFKEKAASGLAHLIKACLNRNPCPNTKIIRNLVTCLSSDPRCTPSASEPLGPLLDSSGGGGTLSDSEGPLSRSSSPSVLEIHNLCNKLSGILTFAKQQQVQGLC